LWNSSHGWIIAIVSGALTATVAAFVDLAVITVSDWKTGYCKGSLLAGKDFCCSDRSPFPAPKDVDEACDRWHSWTDSFWSKFAVYVAFALLFGIISGSLTLITKASLPSTNDIPESDAPNGNSATADGKSTPPPVDQKALYMAAGSGIPEIKTILSGFVIPGLLSLKVLFVKAVGSIFAVSTGMCLGKEGPFVHISVCVAHLVGMRFPKYANNGRKIREVYAAGCAAGLAVAFGAPIGGVLFAYEEIATYFPRKVMWRAFVCSLCAAIVLRQLDPTGTGRLVLFETNWGTVYKPYHYPVFILLGILGGIFGGLFTRLNYLWSRWFRSFSLIKRNPVLEVFLVVLATALLQYPNPLTREPGDVIFKSLLVDCTDTSPTSPTASSYVCLQEKHSSTPSTHYLALLTHGTLSKLLLTIITFGIKVPSGIIIPALDAGAFTGRLLGQLPFLSASLSPGIFAMVGAGAFLAGVSRMTISLAVIMFELTGSLEYTVPTMMAILTATLVANAISPHSVYDVAQLLLAHPFLDGEASLELVRRRARQVRELVPPGETMREITLLVEREGCVRRKELEGRLALLKRRGLLDAGLVLVDEEGRCLGYLGEGELEGGLKSLESGSGEEWVRLLQTKEGDNDGEESIADFSQFVDRTPLTLSEAAPMEYALEMFGKLGLRYLIITEATEVGAEGGGSVVGVVIKKRLVDFLERLRNEHESD
jgi:chloride channel 3/4/5